jgi:diguanylate cyclase (GGDEF)-like protein
VHSREDAARHCFQTRQGLDALDTSREVSFCGHAIHEDDVMVIPDARNDQRFHDNPLVTGAPEISFYAGCPVRGPGGHKLGTLCLIDKDPRNLSREDTEALVEFGRMIEDEFALLSVATTDDLTGLANRRGFERIAGHLLPLARRLDVPLAVVQIDLDGLKKVNDARGHYAGDALLVRFAIELLKSYRESDVVARFGGDEFCVLASGANATQADETLQRLYDICRTGGEPIAFSAGIAMYDPMRHAGVDALLKEADTRMYETKLKKRERATRAE